MKYFWHVIVVVLVLCVYAVKSTQSDIRMFCAYGRVFIEFQEGSSVWGTMMLNDDGVPIHCGNDEQIKTRLKDTI